LALAHLQHHRRHHLDRKNQPTHIFPSEILASKAEAKKQHYCGVKGARTSSSGSLESLDYNSTYLLATTVIIPPAFTMLTFCDLPAEVRRAVYRLLMVKGEVKSLPKARYCNRTTQNPPYRASACAQLLRCNKQCYFEGRAVLYGNNTFDVSETSALQRLRRMARRGSMSAIRHISGLRYDQINTSRLKELGSLPALQTVTLFHHFMVLPVTHKFTAPPFEYANEAASTIHLDPWRERVERLVMTFPHVKYILRQNVRYCMLDDLVSGESTSPQRENSPLCTRLRFASSWPSLTLSCLWTQSRNSISSSIDSRWADNG